MPTLTTGQRAMLCGVVFQLLWFICVLCPLYIVIASTLGFLFLYFNFISRSFRVVFYAAILAVLGYGLDAIWMRLGVFEIDGLLPPLWLAILWFLFSLSLPFAFSFLRKRYVLCSIIGGLGGAFSYVSAIALRPDVGFGLSIPAVFFCVLALWLVLFPAAFYFYEKFCVDSLTQGQA